MSNIQLHKNDLPDDLKLAIPLLLMVSLWD